MQFLSGDYILFNCEIYRVIENYGNYGKVLHLESNNTYEIYWEYEGCTATKQVIVEYTGQASTNRRFFVLSAWNDTLLGYQCIYEPDGSYVMEARGSEFSHNFDILNDRFYIVEINSGSIYNIDHPYISYRKALSELSFIASQSYYTSQCMIIV